MLDYLLGQLGKGIGFALIPSLLATLVLGRRMKVLMLIGAIAGVIMPAVMLYRNRLDGAPIDQAITLLFSATAGALIGLAFHPLKNSWFGPPKS